MAFLDLTCAVLRCLIPASVVVDEDRLLRLRALLSLLWFLVARSLASLFLTSTPCSVHLGLCIFADAFLAAFLMYLLCLKTQLSINNSIGSLLIYKLVTLIGSLRLVEVLSGVVIDQNCPLRVLCVQIFAVLVNVEIFSISFDLLEMLVLSVRWCCAGLFVKDKHGELELGHLEKEVFDFEIEGDWTEDEEVMEKPKLPEKLPLVEICEFQSEPLVSTEVVPTKGDPFTPGSGFEKAAVQ